MKNKDYLALSARIRALESHLLTEEEMAQLADASDEEIVERLRLCGYPQVSTAEDMETGLLIVWQALLEEMSRCVPDQRIVKIFRIKYDYQNLKALLKVRCAGLDGKQFLVELGCVSTEELYHAIEDHTLSDLPSALAEAAGEGETILHTTGDVREMELVLDQCCYKEMLEMAKHTGSAFLQGYLQMQIDGTNLRTLVRWLRMKKKSELPAQALIEGGTVDISLLLQIAAQDGEGLNVIYSATPFAAAAESGEAVLYRGGTFLELEKRCEEAIHLYLLDAQLIPFGEQPLVAYLAARERECRELRILLSGGRI